MTTRARPVAATGRRTGRSTIPEYTKIDSTGTSRAKFKKRSNIANNCRKVVQKSISDQTPYQS